MITADQIDQQKGASPTGWGRFGKALDRLAEIGEPDEALLAACVTLNPTFQHETVSLAGGLFELTKSTNVVLAVTDKRLIILATGRSGGAAHRLRR